MSNLIDMTDWKCGQLTVVGRVYRPNEHNAHWLCKCPCGRTVVVRGDNLISEHTKHCGSSVHNKRKRGII